MTAPAAPETDHGLTHEYEHEPVPTEHRRSLRSVSAVWFGFPMILTNAIFGGTIVYGLGFWKAPPRSSSATSCCSPTWGP